MAEVIIRHSDLNDVTAISNLFQQPSCYSGTLQLPHPKEQQWLSRLSNLTEHQYSLVALIDDTLVAQASLEVFNNPRRKHVANLGMAVSELYRGQGVGSKLLASLIDLANNWLAVTRIELEVYTDNHAAIALYKRHGFVIEGTAKNYAFRDGKYVDVYMMALIKN